MNAESVKARLKNRSKETGKTLQELLTLYGLQRTIPWFTTSTRLM